MVNAHSRSDYGVHDTNEKSSLACPYLDRLAKTNSDLQNILETQGEDQRMDKCARRGAKVEKKYSAFIG